MKVTNATKLFTAALVISALLVACIRPTLSSCIDDVNRLNNQASENAQVRDFEAALGSEKSAIRALLVCEKPAVRTVQLKKRQAEMLTYAGEYAWAAGQRREARELVSRAISMIEAVRSSGALTPTELDEALSDEKTAKDDLAGNWPYVRR